MLSTISRIFLGECGEQAWAMTLCGAEGRDVQSNPLHHWAGQYIRVGVIFNDFPLCVLPSEGNKNEKEEDTHRQTQRDKLSAPNASFSVHEQGNK